MNTNRLPTNSGVAKLLEQLQTGDHLVVDELMPMVYGELRQLARFMLHAERPNHTLQATALVNEAYLRLAGQEHVSWSGKAHFRAIAAKMIRRVLVDYARQRGRAKRGGGCARLTLNDSFPLIEDKATPLDVLALHEAIEQLEKLNDRQARVVELRFFAGMSVPETAEVLCVSDRTVKDDWRFAKAWLRLQMGPENIR